MIYSFASGEMGLCVNCIEKSPPRRRCESFVMPAFIAFDMEPTPEIAATPKIRHVIKMRKLEMPPLRSRNASLIGILNILKNTTDALY